MTAERYEYEGEDEEEGNSINSFLVNKNKSDVLVKFIADSGATEHLSKSELIFEKLDDKLNYTVKCAKRGNLLNTAGSGPIKIRTDRGGEFVLKEVLYSKELSENLLSLRHFVDQGLQVYLDKKR